MEKETVIKALECCSKDDCDHCPNAFGNCYSNLAKSALSLIKELTEDNEKLTSIGINKDIVIESINDVILKLNEENERLKSDNESLATEIKKLLKAAWTVEADTVKKMQESIKNRLTETYGDLPHTNCFINAVDQIAKEMLEGTDERE